MNANTILIIKIFEHIHEQLVEASKLCEESGEKWLRNESLGCDRLDNLVKMHLNSIRSSEAFHERMAISKAEIDKFDTYLDNPKQGLDELLKEGQKYGIPAPNAGEKDSDYLKRVVAHINKDGDFADLSKMISSIELLDSDDDKKLQ